MKWIVNSTHILDVLFILLYMLFCCTYSFLNNTVGGVFLTSNIICENCWKNTWKVSGCLLFTCLTLVIWCTHSWWHDSCWAQRKTGHSYMQNQRQLEQSLITCHLENMYIQVCMYTHTHTHMHINCKKKKKKTFTGYSLVTICFR